MEQENRQILVVKPFQVGKRFTKFNKDLIDHVMPRVSPSAWKVLTVIWRQTEGWVDRKTGERKKWDEISHCQFQRRTGLGSSSTIRRVLNELMEDGYVIRRPAVGREGRQKRQAFEYGLNTTIEIDTSRSRAP